MTTKESSTKVVLGISVGLAAFATCLTLSAGASIEKNTAIEASTMSTAAPVDASLAFAVLPIYGNSFQVMLSNGMHIVHMNDCKNPIVNGKPLYEP